MQRLVVKVEPLQMQCQQVGERLELQSLVGVALAAAVVAVVLVVSVQNLGLDKPAQCLLLQAGRVSSDEHALTFDLIGL